MDPGIGVSAGLRAHTMRHLSLRAPPLSQPLCMSRSVSTSVREFLSCQRVKVRRPRPRPASVPPVRLLGSLRFGRRGLARPRECTRQRRSYRSMQARSWRLQGLLRTVAPSHRRRASRCRCSRRRTLARPRPRRVSACRRHYRQRPAVGAQLAAPHPCPYPCPRQPNFRTRRTRSLVLVSTHPLPHRFRAAHLCQPRTQGVGLLESLQEYGTWVVRRGLVRFSGRASRGQEHTLGLN